MEFLWQHEQAAHSPALTWEEPALPDAPSLGPPGSCSVSTLYKAIYRFNAIHFKSPMAFSIELE